MCKFKLTSNSLSLREAGFTFNERNAAQYIAEANVAAGARFTGKDVQDWGQAHGMSSFRGTEKSQFLVITKTDSSCEFAIVGGRSLSFDIAPKSEPKVTSKVESSKVIEEKPKVITSTDNIDSTAAAIAAALRGLQPQTAKVEIDEAKVREIVAAEVAKIKISNNYKGVEIKTVNGAKKIENNHPLLEDVLGLVVNDIPVYLVGPAGSGKSTLCFQVAEALGLNFYSCSSLQQKYELEGYTDPTGKLVETEFYKFCKDGGVFLIDEIDNTAAEVLIAFNTALANRYYTFPGAGRVELHKDCHFIAAGNTNGRGADNTYNGRFQLDGSTLDRYAFVNVDYCEEIELTMCEGDKELIEFAHDLRKVIADYNLTYTVSPRFLERFKKMQKLGWADEKSLQTALANGWDKVNIKTISAKLSKDNKYSKVFAVLAK